MKTRAWARLGNGGLSFTELGFGSAPLGNLYRAITEAEAQATLEAAWEGACATSTPRRSTGSVWRRRG